MAATRSSAREASALALVAWAALAGAVLGQSASYTYDELNRLTSATIAGSRIEYQYDAAGNITRVFTPYTIAVTKGGAGSGTVADDRGKVDCGADCTGVYDLGALVTLTAIADADSTFLGWSGSCQGAGACLVTVDEAEVVLASFGVLAQADLSISKSDGLTAATPGENIVYTIQVVNSGPSAVAGASVTDDFPASLTCAWTSAAAGGASGSAGAGSGNIDESLSLPPSSSMTYSASCDIDPAATGTLSNTATVASSLGDPNPGDETATDTTTLTPASDLWLTKEANVAEVQQGGSVVYTLRIGNRGPSLASALSVTDTLPVGSTLSAASGDGWACTPGAGTVVCTRSQLAQQQQSEISVEVVAPTTTGSSVNLAEVSAATAEAAPGDEQDSAAVEVFGPTTIVALRSVAATESGVIAPGTSTASALTQLYVDASHDLYDPAGDAEPHDATNPECYRLFAAPRGGVIAPTTCADPTDVAVEAATYGIAGPTTVALRLVADRGLPAGRYRLVVCGTGSNALHDTFGAPIDGDGDGTGGDDFVLDFEVSVTNLLYNPNLDEDLGGWSIVADIPGEVTWDATNDAADALTSGSVDLFNLSGSGSVLEVSQCVQVEGGEAYHVRGKVLANSPGASSPIVSGRIESFDGPTCGGSSLGAFLAGEVVGDTGGFWVHGFPEPAPLPGAAVSAQVTFRVTGDETGVEVWLDDLQAVGSEIFRDGFESGTFSAWSDSVGAL